MEENTITNPEHATIAGIQDIKRKMHLTGSILKTTLAGAIVDIGLDTPGVLHISQLQKEPVNRVEDVVHVGQSVDVWVRRVEPKKQRIELTMIEPPALEWGELEKGLVVKGKVVRLEKFGVFVDIGAERPGLVHISELTHDYIRNPGEVVKEGEEIEVKVLAINKPKKQIKLSMKALEERPLKVAKASSREKVKKATVEAPAEKEEPVPTAMELAMRDAVQRSRTQEKKTVTQDSSKRKASGGEMEKILTRTLEHKVKTATK